MKTRSVTVRRGGVDRHGDPLPQFDHELTGCLVAPATTGEGDERGAEVVVGVTLYAPADADLLASDQVVIDGVLYDVEGEPGRWQSPFSRRNRGLQAALRRTT